jgi:PPK2 family polyphosphate:nucleotide phosphotransferase
MMARLIAASTPCCFLFLFPSATKLRRVGEGKSYGSVVVMGKKKSAQQEVDQLASYVTPFRFDGSGEFQLKSHKSDEKADLDKKTSREILNQNNKRLRKLQEKLYAQNRWSVLLIFQGMDAAGKDSAIEHVMSGINPQGCQVVSFKTPSSKELDHDFMWRSLIALPERGRIGIFNRSYYEECLIVRVHRELLAKEKIPPKLMTKTLWRERFEDISAIERYLARNGTIILKFFLNVSKDEQRRRFLKRLEEPAKNWKFEMGDVTERALWEKYQAAYQDIVRNTSSAVAPWFVVPADHKWFSRVVISSAIVHALEGLDLQFPKTERHLLPDLKKVRIALENEKVAEAEEGTPSADEAPKKKPKRRSAAAATSETPPAGEAVTEPQAEQREGQED